MDEVVSTLEIEVKHSSCARVWNSPVLPLTVSGHPMNCELYMNEH